MSFMANQERRPTQKGHVLNRNGMDENTPHGLAQARFDELVLSSEISGGAPFSYSAHGEPNPEKPTEIENVSVPVKKKKHPTKTHNMKGLTGFYKGTFYRNGVPQKSKK